MTPNSTTHRTCVGIDVSMAKLDVVTTDDHRHRVYAYNERGMKQLAKDLATRNPQRVVMEATGGIERRLAVCLVQQGLPVVRWPSNGGARHYWATAPRDSRGAKQCRSGPTILIPILKTPYALYVTARTASHILRTLGSISCSNARLYGAGTSSLLTRMILLSRSSIARS